MLKTGVIALFLIAVQGCTLCEKFNLPSNPQTKELLESSFGDFFSGFYEGIQSNPEYPSLCVKKLMSHGGKLHEIYLHLANMVVNGDNSELFLAAQAFADYAENLEDIVNICQFNRLVTEFENIRTISSGSQFAVRISVNFNTLVDHWKDFVKYFFDDPQDSGKALGNMMSIILNYDL